MEGVVDYRMRKLLTAINQYDLCITEFVRVVDKKVPKHSFYKIAPELRTSGYSNATPVRIQLLGQEPNWLAENALVAHELGSHGVDLNFGCPAQTVNKSKGGASLLKEPELIYQIVSTVKSALAGTNQPLSVKIRLGFNDTNLLNEIIDAIKSANPDMLTVHARTKKQGYKPPAYWEYIADIQSKLDIPVVANGEIWTKEDAERCVKIAQTDKIMLGRGALATPNIANMIKHNEVKMSWSELCRVIYDWINLGAPNDKPYYHSSRLKQWYRYLKISYSEADMLFKQIKFETESSAIENVIKQYI